MKEFLEQQIALREARLSALDAERSKILAEVSAFKDALAHLETQESFNSKERPGRRTGVTPPIGRGLSPAWIAILTELAGYTRFTSRDVELAARKLQLPQRSVNIRSQLSNYTDIGVVRRLGLGSYVISDETKLLILQRAHPAQSLPGISKPDATTQ